jgi:uncharacterized damage-inducible protein DinB
MSEAITAEVPLLLRNLRQLRAAREHTLSMTTTVTQEQADARSFENKWSIGEVLDHLCLFDHLLSKDLKQLAENARLGHATLIHHSLSEVNVGPAFLPKSLLPLFEIPFTLSSMFVPSFIRNMLARNRRIRFRHPDVAAPRRGRPIHELRKDLRSSIDAIEALLLNNKNVDFRKMYVQHPILGKNNIIQLLSFMTSHEQRHQGQLADLLHRLDAINNARNFN